MAAQTRQTAYIAQIKSLVNSRFVKEEGWKPNYVIDEFGRKLSRINLIASVVDTADPENTFNYYSIVLDDGTARISVRAFDNHERFKSFQAGDIVQIIGRIREYGKERYIIPEIAKKVKNPKWIDVRKKHLQIINSMEKVPVHEEQEKERTQEDNVGEEEIIDNADSTFDSSEKIISLIRSMDPGEGADTDEVIKKSEIEDCENIINSLLLEGNIFEVKPGKLKVLD